MTEKKNKRDRYVRGISFILAFFLAVLLLIVFFLVELKLGMGNSQNLRNSINDSDYTQKAYKEVLSKSKDCVTDRSMPVKIVTEAVTQERFFLDSSKSIKAALSGKASRIDTTNLEKKLTENIDRYLKENRIVKDGRIQVAREEIVQTVAGYYKSCAQFRFGDYFYPMNRMLDKLWSMAVPLLAVLTAVTVMFLIEIQRFRHCGLWYISYSLFAATLANLVFWQKLFFFDSVNAGIEPEYYRKFSADYLRSGMHIAAAITAVGVILFLITVFFANRHRLAGKVN